MANTVLPLSSDIYLEVDGKKVAVVRKRTGLPGRARRPASSMRPFSSRPDTLDEESAPRTCSIKARDTGWL